MFVALHLDSNASVFSEKKAAVYTCFLYSFRKMALFNLALQSSKVAPPTENINWIADDRANSEIGYGIIFHDKFLMMKYFKCSHYQKIPQ